MTECFIGLGSNLENPLNQVEQALRELDDITDTRLLAHSNWYQNPAIGPGEQPDYINGVAQLQTTLTPEQLLAELQQIENDHQRRRMVRWGPRTLDLDLLMYGKLQIDTPTLTVPHPRMAERNFVLYPLAELAPRLVIPPDQSIQMLLTTIGQSGLRVLPS